MNAVTFAMLQKLDEDQARELLEAIRWPDGIICPHCGNNEAYKLTPKETGKKHVRKGVYKCRACRKQFTVTVGTVMEHSKIKLVHWLLCFYLICSSKKGISAHQIHRTLGISYEAAWFMCHRVRFSMTQMPMSKLLEGQVELDATFIGGKEGFMHKSKLGPKTKAHSYHYHYKVPVFALVQRGGELRARKMRTLSNYNIRWEVRKHVSHDATLMTDSAAAYEMIYQEYPHQAVDHEKGEYVRGDAHVNTLEGWFSLLKRGVSGTFHHVSEEHLDRYVNEFVFRYNLRAISDAERTVRAIRQIVGKRLMYKEATEH